mgnify:CR=1 FL=1
MSAGFFAFHKIIVLIIDILAIGLGVIVYRKNPQARTNRLFLIMSLFMIGWVDFAFLGRLLAFQSSSLALFSLKIAWFITPLFFCVLFLFIEEIAQLPKNKKIVIRDRIIILTGIGIALITLFTDLIIKNFVLQDSILVIIYGKGIFLFLGFGFILIVLTLYTLIKSYLHLPPYQKLKIQYFFVGLAIFYLANLIFNIFFPVLLKKTDLYYLGDYSTIVLLAFIAYAIVKRELFGIKVILTEFLVGAIGVILLIQSFLAPDVWTKVFNFLIFFFFSILGYLLIKSVLQEIKLRAQLEKAYKELKKLDEAKTEFLSIASHQLRTPLTAIKGYVAMLKEGIFGKLSDQVLEILNKVYISNERLINLVNSLLDIARLETGRLEFHFQPLQLEEVVESVIKEVSVAAQKKGIYLKYKKPKKPLPKVKADPEKIRQVILNIIDNAVKYTMKGGVTIKFKVKKDRCILIVKDTGIGMTEEELEKAFQMYRRGQGVRMFPEGSGLGLYIAKKFVEAHNGRIWAESPGKDKGSTFYLELPFA